MCTWNNPPLDDASTQEILEKVFKDLKATYLVGQLEKGEEGTLHL